MLYHDTKEKKHKDLKRLERERVSLMSQYHKELIPYEKPVFAGYKRYYVVKEEIARSPYGKDAKELLKLINTEQYSKRKDFLVKQRKTKKLVEIQINLKNVSLRDWKKHKCEDSSAFRKYTELCWVYPKGQTPYQAYRCLKHFWFEPVVEKYYFTHYRDVDGAIATRIAEIDSKLDKSMYWEKEYGWGNYDDDDLQDPHDSRNWDNFLTSLSEYQNK